MTMSNRNITIGTVLGRLALIFIVIAIGFSLHLWHLLNTNIHKEQIGYAEGNLERSIENYDQALQTTPHDKSELEKLKQRVEYDKINLREVKEIVISGDKEEDSASLFIILS